MKIVAKIYSCNVETYKKIYVDAIKRAFAKDNIKINKKDIKMEIIDLSNKGIKNIRSQRNPRGKHNRSITVLQDGEIKYVIGLTNTNFDEDKLKEYNISGGKNTYGVLNYHSNSYLCQGANKIFEYYYDIKKEKPDVKLYFYLLDTKNSYAKNISNLVNYRKLATIGFEVLNLDEISFEEYNERGIITKEELEYESLNKLMNDMIYVSKKNKANIPGYLKCEDLDYEIGQEENEITKYSTNKKYIYTFKTLGAESYDSFLTMWALIKLAEKEGKKLEFLFSHEKYNFRLGQEKAKFTEDFPDTITNLFKKIGLKVKYETSEEMRQQFEREKSQYEKAKEKNELRNQELFKNNIREKGIQTKCYLCGCEIEDVLEAAHLWGVSEIKKAPHKEINKIIIKKGIKDLIDESNPHKKEIFYKKYIMANSGDNGVWLCRNHHGLFDRNYYCFDSDKGKIIIKKDIEKTAKEYFESITKYKNLPKEVLTNGTKEFLKKRKENFLKQKE